MKYLSMTQTLPPRSGKRNRLRLTAAQRQRRNAILFCGVPAVVCSLAMWACSVAFPPKPPVPPAPETTPPETPAVSQRATVENAIAALENCTGARHDVPKRLLEELEVICSGLASEL